jgi:hypothetical protein
LRLWVMRALVRICMTPVIRLERPRPLRRQGRCPHSLVPVRPRPHDQRLDDRPLRLLQGGLELPRHLAPSSA